MLGLCCLLDVGEEREVQRRHLGERSNIARRLQMDGGS